MKLALAAFGTALVIASSASAMIGPYERAVNDVNSASQLFTTGDAEINRASSNATSPEAEWNGGETQTITVFSANATPSNGADAR